MKIENKMKVENVYLAVLKWALDIDNCDGAIGGVLGEIPWGDDIDAHLTWDEVAEDADNVIGTRLTVDVDKYLLFTEYRELINKLAGERAMQIYNWYEGVINKINEKFTFTLSVSRFSYIDKMGVCHWTEYDKIKGDSIYEAITTLINGYSPCGWKKEELIDALYSAYHNGESVSLNKDNSLSWKKN